MLSTRIELKRKKYFHISCKDFGKELFFFYNVHTLRIVPGTLKRDLIYKLARNPIEIGPVSASQQIIKGKWCFGAPGSSKSLRRMVVKTFPDRNKRSPRCSHAHNTESKPLISRVMGGLYYCWRVANRRSSKKKHLFRGANRFSQGARSEESRVSCLSILLKNPT